MFFYVMEEPQADKKMNFLKRWIKRFGVAGFLFFFLKGVILYIVLPALAAYFGFSFFN